MAGSLSITIDGAAAREALEGESLRAVVRSFIKAAARVSADNIQREAKNRLQRQLSGHSTGDTVEGIVVLADRSGFGWIVDAGNARMAPLPRWLEGDPALGGFKNVKRRKPFLMISAALEEDAHERRVADAIQAALLEYGLGPNQTAPTSSASPGGSGLL